MGLIKAANTPVAAAPFSMGDIEQQARALLQQARAAAGRVLEEARAEAEALKRQAHAQGLAEGKKEGLARGREDGLKAGQQAALAEHQAALGQLVEALTTAAAEIDASRRQFENDVTGDVVELAVAIARRATKRLGELDPQVVVANVADAVRLAVQSHTVRIAINPAQRATLDAVLPQLRLSWPRLEHVELIDDPTLTPGGCRVHTPGGEIDADLDRQIDRIAQDLVPSAQQ